MKKLELNRDFLLFILYLALFFLYIKSWKNENQNKNNKIDDCTCLTNYAKYYCDNYKYDDLLVYTNCLDQLLPIKKVVKIRKVEVDNELHECHYFNDQKGFVEIYHRYDCKYCKAKRDKLKKEKENENKSNLGNVEK